MAQYNIQDDQIHTVYDVLSNFEIVGHVCAFSYDDALEKAEINYADKENISVRGRGDNFF